MKPNIAAGTLHSTTTASTHARQVQIYIYATFEVYLLDKVLSNCAELLRPATKGERKS